MSAGLDWLRSRQMPGPVLLVAVAAGYFALAQYVLLLNDPVSSGAGFWPPAGLSLALLMLTRPDRWVWVLAGVALAEFGGDLGHGHPLAVTILWTAGSCVGPLVGAVLLRRLGNRSGLLVPVQQLLRFIVAAVIVGPLAGASIGTIGSLLASNGMDLWQVGPKYFFGDALANALGVLVVAPLLLSLRQRSITRHPGEAIALAVALLVVSLFSFRASNDAWGAALPYLVVPVLMWAALRFGCRGAAIGTFVITQIANWFTSIGEGPFAVAGAATEHPVTLLQFFLAVTATSTLVLAALVEDLVERTEVEARLARQASTDALTGLPNRAVLTSTLSDRITSPPVHAGVGVCACDLDHFKVINDGLGHAAGDEVLVEVARRMRGSVRAADLVARLGGDEFVIVMEGGAHELEEVARRLISAVAVPMLLNDGTTVTPSVSVGLAHAEPGADPSSLLRHADAALFRAKELGRGRLHRFDEQLRLHVTDRLFLQTEVPKALTNEDLYCVYQPEIMIDSGELFSFEALSRWDHPTQGSISPTRFVPVIEEIGLVGQLFDHVLAETLGAQAQWAKQLGFHPAVAVNASARQLGDTDLPGAVAKALARAGSPADSLWIEVTEGAIGTETGSGTLRALHDLGVRLAIDDFGTGWSSMARLASFPWDLLKIDQSFVQALGGPNMHAEQVVISTIALAHALGIPTTAEGVETPQQLERLSQLGCDVAQGYLFAKPSPARQAIEHVTADGRWTGPGTIHAPGPKAPTFL